jgi:hypothetical protein
MTACSSHHCYQEKFTSQWSFPNYNSCQKNLEFSALRECKALALESGPLKYNWNDSALTQNCIENLMVELVKTALYLDTKKCNGCRTRFQWPTIWQWYNVEATAPSTSHSKDTSRLKQCHFRFSLTTNHSATFALACGYKPQVRVPMQQPHGFKETSYIIRT